MVALIHNHSFGLKLWRVVGVVLMLTQSGCDVKDNRIKKRRLRARRECVARQFIAEADGFRCEALTKRGAVRFRPWRPRMTDWIFVAHRCSSRVCRMYAARSRPWLPPKEATRWVTGLRDDPASLPRARRFTEHS